MTDQWDRFAAGAGRTIDALGYDDNVALFVPTESFVQGEGFSVSYPSAPTRRVAGLVSIPSASASDTPGGTTRTADLTVHVRSTLSVALTDAGESGEAKTRVEVNSAAGTYEVDTVVDTNDGLTRLECSEVDVR